MLGAFGNYTLQDLYHELSQVYVSRRGKITGAMSLGYNAFIVAKQMPPCCLSCFKGPNLVLCSHRHNFKTNAIWSHSVLNLNKCHLLIGRPGQNRWGQIKLLHLLPNQNKWHLVIGQPGQNKSGQTKFHVFGNWSDQRNTMD